MRVSVIAPVYNHERYLPECLMSIYDQTWDDLELVVVDDGSADGSFAIARRFCETPWIKSRFSRLVVERNPSNQGAAATINKAVENSTGDVLMIVNSDDRYHPRRAAACSEAIAGGARFVFTGIRCIDEAGRDCCSVESAHFNRTVAEIARYPSVSLALLEKNRTISTGNFCLTRELAELIGPFRPLQYCHDWDFILAAILETEPCWLDTPFYEYRLHGSNTFRSLADIAEADTKACFQRFFQRIDRQLVNNPRLRAMIDAPGLWEPLIRRGGPVIEREWLAVKSGLDHRPVVIAPPIEPDGSADVKETSAGATPKSILEAMQLRIPVELMPVQAKGEIYGDGWIGGSAVWRLRAAPDVNLLTARVWIPEGFQPRLAVFTCAAEGEPPRERVVVLRPGLITSVSFTVTQGARALTISIRVPDAKPTDADRRSLGLVIVGLRTGHIAASEPSADTPGDAIPGAPADTAAANPLRAAAE